MTVEFEYKEIHYRIEDVEYDEYDPGDYWTPPVPGGVTGYGDVYALLDDKMVNVTEVFNSLVDEEDFLEDLEEVVDDKITDAKTDYLIDKYED